VFAEFRSAPRGQKRVAVTGAYVGELLRARVRLHGIQLGRPVDVVLDRDHRRALGFEVHCGDDARRFLPFSVVAISSDTLSITSSLLLLDRSELRFYTDRGATFASLRQTPVERDGGSLGVLEDLRLTEDGVVTTVVVRTAKGRAEVPYDDRITLGNTGVRVAS
jgi:hypothetical protein